MTAAYRYELRRGKELIATGHLALERSEDVGDPIAVGQWSGIVRSIEPLLGEHEQRLAAQLRRDFG
jgi:hypothetical protein